MLTEGEVTKMIRKNILIVLIMSFAFTAQASWKVRSAYKKVPGVDVDRSVLYFTSGDVTKTYAPNKPPFGLISTDKYVTSKGEFYLTGWAKGGQSVLFRVFDMSKKDASPICEVTSFGEISKLKLKKGVIYVEKTDELHQTKSSWQACAKLKPRL